MTLAIHLNSLNTSTGQDAERVAPYFNGILVGTALMQAEDVAQRIKELQIDKG